MYNNIILQIFKISFITNILYHTHPRPKQYNIVSIGLFYRDLGLGAIFFLHLRTHSIYKIQTCK